VFGLLYAPVWPADILHFYGVYIAIGAFLLAAPERWLWTLVFIFTAGFVVLLLVLNYEQGWNWETLTYTDFWTPVGMVRHLFFNSFHPVFPWTAFLLVGMWLGRQDISDPACQRRILGAGVGAVLLAEGASWLMNHTFPASTSGSETVGVLFGTAPMPPMQLYLLSGGGTALVVITLSIVLTERLSGARWLEPFVATGQLALTHYVAHVVVGMGLLETFGLLENQSLTFAVAGAVVFCAGAVLFSFLWQKRFKRGPLEWMIRRVTGWGKL
jgi:uncharacterized membrane protein YeiB